jgi:dTDP-4-amino-4,6-dideoxygalactose transaminase
LAAFKRVIDNSAFILGAEVSNFEKQIENYLGVTYAVGVSSGTDALYIALRSLGIGPGDEVITTPLSFVATAEAVIRCGATPVFADIDPNHWGLCPVSTAKVRTKATRAVLPVHLFGHPGSIVELQRYCHDEGLFLVEDACQALGAHVNQRPLGTLGHIGVFSFFPTKPLGGFGDGGMIVTKDERLFSHAKELRSHGLNGDGVYASLGGNYRLDGLQAALLSVKLSHVDSHRRLRRKIAERYSNALLASTLLRPPCVTEEGIDAAWSLYTLRVPRHRDALIRHLNTCGIESRIYYSKLLFEQPSLRDRCRIGEIEHAKNLTNEVLSVPCYAEMTEREQQQVVDALLTFSPPQ